VLQLADVARPVVVAEALHRRLGDRDVLSLVPLPVHPLEEVLDQGQCAESLRSKIQTIGGL